MSAVNSPSTARSVRTYGHHIDGQISSPSDRLIERYAPADGSLVARYTAGTNVDAELAIAAARTAFDEGPWPKLTAMGRAKILLEVARAIRANADRLSRIDAEEAGKPLMFALGDVEASAELFEYAAGAAMTSHGESHTGLGEDCLAMVLREPAGVVGMIIPWNFPLLLLAQKLPFALAAGCTTVIKPSEFTSGTALELARIAEDAGVPAGVINVVTGYGVDTGEPLARSTSVDVLSFTGSTETGRRITVASAGSVKRLSMELGGKAASVVFDDADLTDALDGVLFGVFFNNGECCVSGARLLIQDTIADAFVDKLVNAVSRIAVGAPLSMNTELGPMISPEHAERVIQHIEQARLDGARLRVGGSLVEGIGNYVLPTILDNVSEGTAAFTDEIFGPVLTVTRFKNIDDAISLANATDYGLAGSIWSKDIDKALIVARNMRNGRVWINTTIDGGPQLPAGGMKQSGFGREMGSAGFEEFTEIKTVQIRTGPRDLIFPNWVAN
ncbi:sorbosone dehydrogenase [Rhodococcus sp. 06-156-3C]|uniref:aldehyde dehydrogenase family protein n=1 Tax=Nocardiaceae TaxID=85025 RepID=UPI000522F96C|nr:MULTISPECIES: aldehyde dehydrogenase family protein [Rhodococcus]OZD18248.1 sorbosone dehydrogenase [Rhodococcus sp. 06-156-4C]OZD18846.1 sorbosone dehydrogenase [Rhodococcus sp. 06-156-3C]OZD22356.1 sorbosone dehydrogenase [Rhodococcus sp. 06-156-4a]OZD33940.1 sorbosone dehydrogenase [Rhodococcus sp. 06-156-3b]OZD38677.1 sorbosone dehydrogenase [Rhodococcus sp. 06-156-3]